MIKNPLSRYYKLLAQSRILYFSKKLCGQLSFTGQKKLASRSAAAWAPAKGEFFNLVNKVFWHNLKILICLQEKKEEKKNDKSKRRTTTWDSVSLTRTFIISIFLNCSTNCERCIWNANEPIALLLFLFEVNLELTNVRKMF